MDQRLARETAAAADSGSASSTSSCVPTADEVTVESEPGAGSLFRVVLPSRTRIARRPHDRPPHSVVEDEPVLVRALTDALVASGCEVMSALDGERGLELALEKSRS